MPVQRQPAILLLNIFENGARKATFSERGTSLTAGLLTYRSVSQRIVTVKPEAKF